MTLTNMNIKLFCATTESDEPRILKGGFRRIKSVMYANWGWAILSVCDTCHMGDITSQ